MKNPVEYIERQFKKIQRTITIPLVQPENSFEIMNSKEKSPFNSKQLIENTVSSKISLFEEIKKLQELLILDDNKEEDEDDSRYDKWMSQGNYFYKYGDFESED